MGTDSLRIPVNLLVGVTVLRLEHLKLTDATQDLSQVQELICQGSHITQIHNDVWNALPALRTALLQKNKLRSFPTECLEHCSKIIYLNLDHNKISTIPTIHTTSLLTLSLAYNQLTCIPSSLLQPTSLIKLTLDYNAITIIPSEVSNWKSMERLSLLHTRYPLPLISTYLLAHTY
ncbi:leucine rich repeat protein [Gregarina niphandrodes]|uniref:Leucine rich repeat protein n=1 Tax=Gregarina niphandrodes TaxID=110365 RepID=A0A023B8K3_GRENI|nr:leucine rich repeat protein [Gregarina niphandrodes]EZG69286.1 leucine rich repeat protein [Gregarina niphandrodes]|eukprot:XP_011134449.1 leucine rich repeat protein [Gregarina niphandrodes]